jgi:hypothetical protein
METLLQATPNGMEMRIVKRWQNTNWRRVWAYLWDAPVPESTKEIWYSVMHDIIPTRERLLAIKLIQTDTCASCQVKDTLSHRIIGCGEGHEQWDWTRRTVAAMLRMDPRWINEEWLYRPQFCSWLKQRQKAVLWLLAQLTEFRFQREKGLTIQDYFDFLKRAKWKLDQQHKRQLKIGNYLSVIETAFSKKQ